MKAYTDLEQSHKLAEILPLESADGFWEYHDKWCSEGDEWEGYEDYPRTEPYLEYPRKENEWKEDKSDVPCWSLAALLDVLPFHLIVNNQRYAFSMHKGLDKDGETYMLRYNVFNTDVCLCLTDHYNSTVDACYEMIIKLHEQKLFDYGLRKSI